MKTSVLLTAFTVACLAFSVQAADMQFKHMQRGITCQQCHGVASPSTPAKAKNCNKCHNYSALAEQTSPAKKPNLKLNPHDSHAGGLRGTLCHREHAASVNHCKTCHKSSDPKFNFNVP